MSFGERLKEARQNAGYTQDQLAKLIGVAKSTLSGYEKGNREPDVMKIWKIITALDISGDWLLGGENRHSFTVSLNPEEKTHIKKYRALDERGKSNVDVLLENEYRHAMNYKTSGIACKIYLVPEYLQPASAGAGEWNDDDLTESLELLREPPKGTSYVVRVHGDSMKPTFRDGDRLFVRAQDTLEQGEIGIFNIDGEMFVKELRGKHLMSHNPAYEPIRLTESTRCQGKVLGVCDDSFFE